MSIKEFNNKGYLYINNVLDNETCSLLVDELNRLIKEKQTVNDDQCPKSEAIHGTPTFDKLLENLLPHFEKVCGKKLYPTYSYARLYKPGEELKRHTDRPACEISVTLTLGFEGNPWSIYMAGNKLDMQVGDAVLYRGMDVEHWREKYTEGQWQAQVFLHYVDADGPHKDEKYDRRSFLSHHQYINMISDFYTAKNSLSDKFCDKLIEEYSKDTVEKLPPTIGQGDGVIDTSIRDVKRLMLPSGQSVGATLTSFGLNINYETYKYNITHSNQTEFLIYEVGGKYQSHVDTFHSHSEETRKLTVLVFLNDDFEGGKFYIQIGHQRTYPPQEKGTILAFPSFMLHGVEPVTKGIRYSCVTWLLGPYFK